VPDVNAALQDAVKGQDAAVYAFGLVTAQLTGAAASAALAAMADHRVLRDYLRALLVAASASPPAAAAAYDPPFPVNDARSARRLAALVEDRCVGQLAALVGLLPEAQRRAVASAAQLGAVRTVSWSGVAATWPGSS
jgi:hypothetical protein